METRITIQSQHVLDGLKRAPATVEANVEFALDRGALELARRARDLAAKAFTTLANSIHVSVIGRLQRMALSSGCARKPDFRASSWKAPHS
jgi:hypothetical protein